MEPGQPVLTDAPWEGCSESWTEGDHRHRLGHSSCYRHGSQGSWKWSDLARTAVSLCLDQNAPPRQPHCFRLCPSPAGLLQEPAGPGHCATAPLPSCAGLCLIVPPWYHPVGKRVFSAHLAGGRRMGLCVPGEPELARPRGSVGHVYGYLQRGAPVLVRGVRSRLGALKA